MPRALLSPARAFTSSSQPPPQPLPAASSAPPRSTLIPASSNELPTHPYTHVQHIRIDRSGLLGMSHDPSEDDSALVPPPEVLATKTPWTPLVGELRAQIKIKGPLSVSDYMFQCLQNPQYGYYTTRAASTVIGGKKPDTQTAEPAAETTPAEASTPAAAETESKQDAAAASADSSSAPAVDPSVPTATGDFITSPELGQIFGEMVGIWVVHVWEQLGKPQRVRLLELGPGKGTLMHDVLRTAAHWPQFLDGLSVHLCETSPQMREAQIERLCVKNVVQSRAQAAPEAPTVRSGGRTSPSPQALEAARAQMAKETIDASIARSGGKLSRADAEKAFNAMMAKNADRHLDEVATDLTKEENALRSMLKASSPPKEEVDMLIRGEITLLSDHPAPVMPPLPTINPDGTITPPPPGPPPPPRPPAPRIPIHWHSKLSQLPASMSDQGEGPIIVIAHEFFDALPVYQFHCSDRGWVEKLVDMDSQAHGPARKGGPHHLRFVLSAQPTAASKTFLPASRFPPGQSRIGEEVEIGAAGLACMEDLSMLLLNNPGGGAALVVDYGSDHPHSNTLQALSAHKFTPVLERPGEVDLTALVDFKSLRAIAERTSNMHPKAPGYPLTVFPLITQSHFLRELGIAARLQSMVVRVAVDRSMNAAQIDTLISNARRLVDPDRSTGGMGRHFKVLGMVTRPQGHGGVNTPLDIHPFNFPDPLMDLERSETEAAGKARRAGGAMGGLMGKDTATEAANETQSRSSAALPSATGHVFSATPPVEKSKDEGAAANRRAAAREAAAELAKARAAREAAAAADNAQKKSS